LRLVKQQCGFLNNARYVLNKPGCHVAIYHAVVEGSSDSRYLADNDLVFDNPMLFANRTKGNNAHLARVQDRCAGINTENTDVCDGDVASRFVQDVASVIEEPALLLD